MSSAITNATIHYKFTHEKLLVFVERQVTCDFLQIFGCSSLLKKKGKGKIPDYYY